MYRRLCLPLMFSVVFAGAAAAQEVTIGLTMGTTGPGASLGVHYKNAFQLMPKTIGGYPVKFIMLEDKTDATEAAKNARELITQDNVDAVMGSVAVPSTTQIAQIASELKTPHMALSPVALPPDKLEWTFVVPQTTPLMMGAVVDHMKALGVPESEIKATDDFGSSDLGNVGHAYPTVNLVFKIAPEGTAGHSDAFREYAASEDGWKATVIAAKAIALTAYDLLTHPDKVKEIQEKFKELKSNEGK